MEQEYPRDEFIVMELSEATGPQEVLWNAELEDILGHNARAFKNNENDEIAFVIDETPVSELELGTTMGFDFPETLKGALENNDFEVIDDAIASHVLGSTGSIWDRRRLSSVLKLNITSDKLEDLKQYAANLSDRLIHLENLQVTPAKQEQVSRALNRLTTDEIHEKSYEFLKRAFDNDRFFARFKEMNVTFEQIKIAEEHNSRNAHLQECSLVDALSTGTAANYLNRLLFSSALKSVAEESKKWLLQIAKSGVKKVYAGFATMIAGPVIGAVIQYNFGSKLFGDLLFHASAVAGILIFMKGLREKESAKTGLEIDKEIAYIYAETNLSNHNQTSASIRPVGRVLRGFITTQVRNTHKIIECGTTIDALNLFGLSYPEIAKLIPPASYDGRNSISEHLRLHLWRLCESWGIEDYHQFRTVYRALHARRNLERRIEQTEFANLAAAVLLEEAK